MYDLKKSCERRRVVKRVLLLLVYIALLLIYFALEGSTPIY